MHGHHPDAVARAIGAALHLDLAGFQPDEEAGQARHLHPFISHRLRQQRVDPVLGFGAKTGKQVTTTVVPGQDALDQVVGPQEI